MAKKIKKVYNTKLLYRWSLPLWLTLLFILVTIAPLAVSLFMQCFSMTIGDKVYEFKTMNLVLNMLQQPDESGAIPALASYLEMIKASEDMGAKIMGMTLSIGLSYAIPAFGALMALFDGILVIFLLVGLISGRFHHWKGPFVMSVWATINGLLYFGAMVGLCFYMNNVEPQFEGAGIAGYHMDFLFAAIYFGAMLVSTIALGIIYSAGFKNKEFIPNKEYLDNYIQQMNHGMSNSTGYTPQPIIINNNTQPAAQPAVISQPQQAPVIVQAGAPQGQTVVETRYVTKVKKVHETEVDPSLKHISGHAYAKNVHMLSATIPEGVDVIGPSAFANCVNLKEATIPSSVKEIGYNAFFNCTSLQKIVYAGTKDQWRKIKRGSNWLAKAGTTIVSCVDGAIKVNPYRK